MFDVRDEGVSELEKNLKFLITSLPKEAKMILRKAGSKARTVVARKARQLVEKHDGVYHKRWKRGKVWINEDGTYRVRIYNSSPHAHLLEDGWIITGKDGTQHGFKQGYKVMDKANREVEDQWDDILESEIDKLLDKM